MAAAGRAAIALEESAFETIFSQRESAQSPDIVGRRHATSVAIGATLASVVILITTVLVLSVGPA